MRAPETKQASIPPLGLVPWPPESDEGFQRLLPWIEEQCGLSLPEAARVQIETLSGNINRVKRLTLLDAGGERLTSLIVKAMPKGGRLERYPELTFPESRLSFEAAYYQASSRFEQDSQQAWTPTCHGFFEGRTSLGLGRSLSSQHLRTISLGRNRPFQALENVWRALREVPPMESSTLRLLTQPTAGEPLCPLKPTFCLLGAL